MGFVPSKLACLEQWWTVLANLLFDLSRLGKQAGLPEAFAYG
jgi:hypothetical protein